MCMYARTVNTATIVLERKLAELYSSSVYDGAQMPNNKMIKKRIKNNIANRIVLCISSRSCLLRTPAPSGFIVLLQRSFLTTEFH